MAVKPKGPDVATLAKFLTERHAADATRLQPLQGGFWSSAYEADGASWVLRLGNTGDGFAIDKDAMQFAGPGLPIPHVMETGFALDHHYAISRRHLGEFVEMRPAEMADAVGEALVKLLAALRSVAPGHDDRVVWYDADNNSTWRERQSAAFLDQPGSTTSGWRNKLAGNPPLHKLFRAAEAKIVELLPACPERRGLVHALE